MKLSKRDALARRRAFGTEKEIQASLDFSRKIHNAVSAAYGIKIMSGAELVRMNHYKDYPTGQYKAEVTSLHAGNGLLIHWYAWGKTEAKAWEALHCLVKTNLRRDMNRRRKALKILE